MMYGANSIFSLHCKQKDTKWTPPTKKRKVEDHLQTSAGFDWEISFHKDYSPTNKITKPSTASSRYNGVSKKKGDKRYKSKFSGYSLGSYILETDAALAYDALVRASGRKGHVNKINFSAQQDYMEARECELKARDISVDLEEILEYISSKVKGGKEEVRRD